LPEEIALPEGWVHAQVNDLMCLVNGFPFKPTQWGKTGLPIIRIQNLNNQDAAFNYCSEDIPARFRVKRGDLLFAWSGTPGTSFGAHIWEGGDAWLNQHIFRAEFNQALIDKQFLRHAINQNLDDYIHQAHGGAGLAHITKGKFESSFILLPPLIEQQRIVAKVEALLGEVKAARQRLAKVPAILKRFRQTVLAAAFSGRLSVDWREANAETGMAHQLVESIRKEKELLPSLTFRKSFPEFPDDSREELGKTELPESWVCVKLHEICSWSSPRKVDTELRCS
jgi:type I restriction enzyme S subunit